MSTAADEMEYFAAKAALRNSIKIALKQLKCQDRSTQSLEVTKKLLAHPKYLSSKGVAVFLSMKDEVDTEGIVRNIFDSGKHCYIPRLVFCNTFSAYQFLCNNFGFNGFAHVKV